ncbi:MAG: DUF6231 family protein [Marinobacter sp.]
MDAQALFEAMIDDCRPASLIVAGTPAMAAARRWQGSHPDVTIDQLETDGRELTGASARPHDLALITDTLETLAPAAGSVLLGQLRNLGNLQIAVLVSNASDWTFNNFIALGFVRQASNDGYTLYTYNIDTYNHKRDWNNPKYWANPEMWDKARW